MKEIVMLLVVTVMATGGVVGAGVGVLEAALRITKVFERK